MKSFIAVGVLLASAFVSAQSITDLPACSLPCLLSAAQGAGCSPTDFACSCGKAAQLSASVTPCVQSACPSAADQAKVISVLEGICAAAGFPVTLGPPKPTSSAPPPAQSSDDSKPPASSAAPEPTGAASSMAPYPPAGSVCTAATTYSTVTVSPPGPGSYNMTSAPTPPAYTGAATANGVTFGAALFGVLAYLL